MTAEQHWELLAEAADGLAASTNFEVERGALPGGTTKFSPAPTATFEVVGKHSGGGASTSWRVDLSGGGSTLASVTFTNADSTTRRKSASFTWPSSNTDLDAVSAVKANAGAGTFDLRKASIAIKQQGTITRTVARVPLGLKQLNPQNTGAQIVADPAFYRHVAADFSPAPTVRLRATGAGTLAVEIRVRLATASGSPVSGSELAFTSNTLTSKETGALSLNNNTDYVMQLWMVDLGGAHAIEPNPPGFGSTFAGEAKAVIDSFRLKQGMTNRDNGNHFGREVVWETTHSDGGGIVPPPLRRRPRPH